MRLCCLINIICRLEFFETAHRALLLALASPDLPAPAQMVLNAEAKSGRSAETLASALTCRKKGSTSGY